MKLIQAEQCIKKLITISVEGKKRNSQLVKTQQWDNILQTVESKEWVIHYKSLFTETLDKYRGSTSAPKINID